MKSKRTITIAMMVIALAAITTSAIFRSSQSVQAHEQVPLSVPDRISFAMVGITAGQTIRVNVTNLLPPVGDLPPGPVRVTMAFRGMNGNLARNARTGEVIRRVVDLQSGDSAFLDIDYDELPPGPTRVQLRAVVIVQYPEGTVLPADIAEHKPFVSSMEVINVANARTQFVLSTPAVIRGFNPQPDPPIE